MDTESDSKPPAGTTFVRRAAVVGAGRLGTALAAALRDAGIAVDGPLRRDATLPDGVDAVLLCVPDAQIATAADALPSDRQALLVGHCSAATTLGGHETRGLHPPLVGHCSAATTLAPLGGHETRGLRPLLVGHCSAATTLAPLAGHEAFSLHPLMTVPERGASFAGATAAVAGATPRALAAARELALALGMLPVHVADDDRAAYHAAASVASNFLVTLEGFAERLAASAGIERERLVALVRASVENWAASGAADALTGPIARGDEETVRRQRAAVAERSPDDRALFDALADATRRLAASRMAAA